MAESRQEELLYQEVYSKETISQGDILFNFPIVLPNQLAVEKEENPFIMYNANIIVMSQACDLILDEGRNRYPVDPVICAAIYDIGNFSWELVSQTNSGNRPAYFLLNRDEKFLDKSYIIDFGKIFTIPYKVLDEFAKKSGDRFRPISPILEKISQHFGNYFSRIGTEYERNKQNLKEEHKTLREKHIERIKEEKKQKSN